jgi:hypothetical protein
MTAANHTPPDRINEIKALRNEIAALKSEMAVMVRKDDLSPIRAEIKRMHPPRLSTATFTKAPRCSSTSLPRTWSKPSRSFAPRFQTRPAACSAMSSVPKTLSQHQSITPTPSYRRCRQNSEPDHGYRHQSYRASSRSARRSRAFLRPLRSQAGRSSLQRDIDAAAEKTFITEAFKAQTALLASELAADFAEDLPNHLARKANVKTIDPSLVAPVLTDALLEQISTSVVKRAIVSLQPIWRKRDDEMRRLQLPPEIATAGPWMGIDLGAYAQQ